MHVAPALPASRFALWLSLETQTDRWASYGAFAVGALALVASLVIL